MVISGDISRRKDLLLPPPEAPEWADYLILECTYGDCLHPKEDVDRLLSNTIEETIIQTGL